MEGLLDVLKVVELHELVNRQFAFLVELDELRDKDLRVGAAFRESARVTDLFMSSGSMECPRRRP